MAAKAELISEHMTGTAAVLSYLSLSAQSANRQDRAQTAHRVANSTSKLPAHVRGAQSVPHNVHAVEALRSNPSTRIFRLPYNQIGEGFGLPRFSFLVKFSG